MKILIHGRNIELTDSLKEYTKSKIHKSIHHYKDIHLNEVSRMSFNNKEKHGYILLG